MSHIKVWIHAVWSTKGRFPFLQDHIRGKVFNHMVSNARSKGIAIDRINGFVDHVHVLIYLRATQNLADVVQQLKGESSRWVNKNSLTEEPFEWQTDYYASSVNESALEATRHYIDCQEAHHRKVTFTVEMNSGFDLVRRH